MRWKKSIQLVDIHCEGEVGKVVISGVYDIPGITITEKMDYLNKTDDRFRRFVCLEPRGAVNQTVNLMVPSDDPDIDARFIVLQADEAHPMSGANTMCVATALLEMGMVEMQEPQTTLKLEAPAGVVTAMADCDDGRCLSVSLDMIPAFVHALDQTLKTETWGDLPIDIAFGGVYYAIVNVADLGFEIDKHSVTEIVEAGMQIKALANEQFQLAHPDMPSIDHIAYAILYQDMGDGVYRTCCTLWPGRVDRSPCGTGSSAIAAMLHARGRLAVDQAIETRSIIDSKFDVSITGTTEIGGQPAVLPRVRGRCWTYGFSQLALDPDDPFPDGFALADAWGSRAAEID